MDKIRVAIIVSHPIQHHVHLYRALATVPELELRVFFGSNIGAKSYFDSQMGVEIRWNTDLLDGYANEFLPEAEAIRETGLWAVNNPSIIQALTAFDPQVVQLHGYAQLTLLRALVWCRWKQIPVLLWSDSSLLFQRRRIKSLIKRPLLSLLMRQFSGVLSTGDNNEAYYRHYGVPEEKLHRCPFTVDEALLSQALEQRSTIRQALRVKYGIGRDAIVLLFVAKLVPWKRPKDLLDALLRLREQTSRNGEVVAFFAGDGALRAELEGLATRENLPAIFGGFINVDLLPSIYAMSDVLVFPSDREPYGLSAREAVCVGLPLIVSDQIGCTGKSDAARPNVNAIVYPSGDAESLTNAINTLVGDSDLRSRMGEASLRVAREMSLKHSVDGFLGAVRAALADCITVKNHS
jgi:glycosyltransferase involved in cell wall biosynthesis